MSVTTLAEMWRTRLTQTLRETGVGGVLRRSSRLGLVALRDAADVAAKRLLQMEEKARVTGPTRTAVLRNAQLKGIHAGKPAFVIGAGPSLRGRSLAAIGEDAITFGCGSVFRHPHFVERPLTYYGVMDWGYFQNPDVNTPFFEELRAAMPEGRFFVPSMFREEIRQHDWLPEERTFYVPMGAYAHHLPWDDIDLSFVPATPNSLQFCLVVALYLGCSPVILLGADHDWLKFPATREAITAAHWDGKEAIDLKAHHARAGHEDYHDLVQYSAGLWQGYKNIHQAAQRRGQVVLNGTPGSLLDVFPTITLAGASEPT